MLSPADSPRGKLLQQYVCARVTKMDDIDLGLFDYDRYNTLYYFILNADEQIYLRYGGRDAESANTYLNLESLELALEKGLELHRQYQEGELEAAERPAPWFARDVPALFEGTTGGGRCVECHLIADLQNVQRERDGTLDKLAHMYRSPDIKRLGIHLDIPQGLVVNEAQGAVREAGMVAGDRITRFNGAAVWTFGDLQYVYDKVDRRSRMVTITVARDGESIDLPTELPGHWWWTELRYRQWSVEPRVYFRSRPLSAEEKAGYGLPPEGFAGQVEHVDRAAELLQAHELRIGDIVVAVDGVEDDEIANTPELFIKLRRKAGETVRLDVIREGALIQTELRTARMSFRK